MGAKREVALVRWTRGLVASWGWNKVSFWRDLALIFLAASWIGHLIEIIWVVSQKWMFGVEIQSGVVAHWWEPYGIYGMGAVLIVLLLNPIKKKTENFWAVLGSGIVVMGILELVVGLILTAWYGANPYWNYSGEPLNLWGQICFRNTMLFGLLATAIVWWGWPWVEKMLDRVPGKILNAILGVLTALFVAYYVVGSLV